MPPIIRLATGDDAEAVRAIYAPFCDAVSHVSFEVEAPSVEEMRRRIENTLSHHPWLVSEEGGEILGYVYAGPHRERAAYRWSVDVSAYIGRRRSGVGRGLYRSLFAILKLQGFMSAFAGATLPNEASVGLHRAMGFEEVGVYRRVGFKAGAWRDVVWWRLALREPPDDPAEPLTLEQAQRLNGWAGALASGLPLIRTPASV
ncbi:MAG TPA: GNAT family N-acetyltransferase [Isosphaeraceae bacterium]|nr:GNAT family N-acetyltransferase [Isosphaeraceae bacterium]